MKHWMDSLAAHHRKLRRKYPGERLLAIFDIDGTILDTRYMILYVLRAFDKRNSTSHFAHLGISDIDFHEEHLRGLLENLGIAPEKQEVILREYEELMFTSTAMLKAHRAFPGVLEVIRWLQCQPETYVGLNTGRPEALRFNTLNALNELGKGYCVAFPDSFLCMKKKGSEQTIPASKLEGIERFVRAGFRILAMVDNEPENLEAAEEADPDGEILLLHADTIFKSRRRGESNLAISGKVYDAGRLMASSDILLDPIDFIFDWTDGDEERLQRFLSSDVGWIGTGVTTLLPSPGGGIFLPGKRINPYCFLDLLRKYRRRLKIYLSGRELHLGNVPRMVRYAGFDDHEVAFGFNVTDYEQRCPEVLRNVFPHASIDCPADVLLRGAPTEKDGKTGRPVPREFNVTGIKGVSLDWRIPCSRKIFNRFTSMGHPVHVYNVRSARSFVQAALLRPASITSLFSFGEEGWVRRPGNRDISEFSADRVA
jgi:hypothetical protein